MALHKLEPINLQTFEGGLADELFQHALGQVLADIDDPNTAPDAVRGIILTFSIKPAESREHALVHVKCTTKLAGIRPAEAHVYLKHQGGKLHALGANPAQMDFTEDQPPAPAPKLVVQTEGGK